MMFTYIISLDIAIKEKFQHYRTVIQSVQQFCLITSFPNINVLSLYACIDIYDVNYYLSPLPASDIQL